MIGGKINAIKHHNMIYLHGDYLYEKGWNYYFTPLGKSWVCVKAADQGTLRLYNVDDEIIGNMTLYNIKVQPFVKRAKGKWGEGNF